MSLLWILLQIQFLGLLISVLVLRANLPRSVLAIIGKNSIRMDGSFSKRRNWIEKRSLDRCFVPIYLGATILFVVTALGGLATSELKLPLPNLAIDTSTEDLLALEDKPSAEPRKMTEADLTNMTGYEKDEELKREKAVIPWPLIAVYFFSSLLVCPLFIGNLHRKAINRYRASANVRFMDYYRSESVRILQTASTASRTSKPTESEPASH